MQYLLKMEDVRKSTSEAAKTFTRLQNNNNNMHSKVSLIKYEILSLDTFYPLSSTDLIGGRIYSNPSFAPLEGDNCTELPPNPTHHHLSVLEECGMVSGGT